MWSILRQWQHEFFVLPFTYEGEWIYLVEFPAFLQEETNSVTSCLIFCTPDPFEIRVYATRKIFAPEVDPY